MTVAKDHIRLTEKKMIRWSKPDMKRIKDLAKLKSITVTNLIRMIVADYLNEQSRIEKMLKDN